ncbi:MAG TPA: hypothetical protein VHP11_12965 [Tepidisphaeraceae bacterium]|nr:hypothetical protein [Tepidisphaeraceae bacterium]
MIGYQNGEIALDSATRSELTSLAHEARALETSAGKLAARLEKLLQSAPPDTGADPFKRADGRLTDAGIVAVNAAFDAGSSVTEVARRFGIHVSASSNRRKIWMATRKTS